MSTNKNNDNTTQNNQNEYSQIEEQVYKYLLNFLKGLDSVFLVQHSAFSVPYSDQFLRRLIPIYTKVSFLHSMFNTYDIIIREFDVDFKNF